MDTQIQGSSKHSVRALFKQTFSLYQFYYHGQNWENCPAPIVAKVNKIVNNINLPSSEYAHSNSFDFKKELQGAADNFLCSVTEICDIHLQNNMPLFPWIEFSSHEVFLALIMTKKRAKKRYRKIRHDIISDMCEEFTVLNPSKFWFEYANNYIINKSEDITPSRCVSSEESVPASDSAIWPN